MCCGMKKKSSGKKTAITIIAVLAAVIGAAVAVYAFLRKKAEAIGRQLDYDGSIYYEDDDDDEEDGLCTTPDCCCCQPEDAFAASEEEEENNDTPAEQN